MKFILSVVLIVLSIFNVPIAILFGKTQKWYLPLWKEDKILYLAFAPFYWALFILAFTFGYPCEQIPKYLH